MVKQGPFKPGTVGSTPTGGTKYNTMENIVKRKVGACMTTTMPSWTVDELLAEQPCLNYTRERITSLWATEHSHDHLSRDIKARLESIVKIKVRK